MGSSGLYRRDLAPSRHGPLGAATQRPRGFCYGADETDNAPSPSTAWYSAWLSLNIHFHRLFLDGVYDFKGRRPTFHRAPRPTPAELTKLLHTIGQRVARLLGRLGLLVRDADSDYLDFEPGEAFDRLVGASMHYRIAIGPNAGRKALTLRTVPVQSEPFPSTLLARLPGVSLHAATVCEAAQRDKLEKLCRTIARPAIANERLSINERGQVIYRFKQPFRDGSTHIVLEPLELMAHMHVRHPAGDLRSSKSAILPICHRPPGGFGSASAIEPHPVPRHLRAELQASRVRRAKTQTSPRKAG